MHFVRSVPQVIMLNHNARVLNTNNYATNGVFHEIDTVLVGCDSRALERAVAALFSPPPSFSLFCAADPLPPAFPVAALLSSEQFESFLTLYKYTPNPK